MLNFSFTVFIMLFFSVSDKNCVYLIIFRKYEIRKSILMLMFSALEFGLIVKTSRSFQQWQADRKLKLLIVFKSRTVFFFSWQTRGRVLHQSQICGSSVCTSAVRWGASQQSGFSEQTGEEVEQQLRASAPKTTTTHPETPARFERLWTVRLVERITSMSTNPPVTPCDIFLEPFPHLWICWHVISNLPQIT